MTVFALEARASKVRSMIVHGYLSASSALLQRHWERQAAREYDAVQQRMMADSLARWNKRH